MSMIGTGDPFCSRNPTRKGVRMILPKVRDPRFITIRRGGTLTDSDHHLLAMWAAACAEHVLYLFETTQPGDPRPRYAIEQARAWARSEINMSLARAAGGHALGPARDLRRALRSRRSDKLPCVADIGTPGSQAGRKTGICRLTTRSMRPYQNRYCSAAMIGENMPEHRVGDGVISAHPISGAVYRVTIQCGGNDATRR